MTLTVIHPLLHAPGCEVRHPCGVRCTCGMRTNPDEEHEAERPQLTREDWRDIEGDIRYHELKEEGRW